MIGGADPGRNGAIVWLSRETNNGWFWKPEYSNDGLLLGDRKTEWLMKKTEVLFFEKVQGRHGWGATNTFQFGLATGQLLQLVRGNLVPIRMVPAQTWQKKMHAGIADKLTPKQRSLCAYLQLFPHDPIKALNPKKKIDEGIMDAMLIAGYGAITLGVPLRKWELKDATNLLGDAA